MTETKHMTFDELMKVYDKAASNVAFLQYEGPDHRAGIRAVVEALRDEWFPQSEPPRTITVEERWFLNQLNEILASDGVEGTHGSPELDEDARKLEAMGQDAGPTVQDLFPEVFVFAAAPVCEWKGWATWFPVSGCNPSAAFVHRAYRDGDMCPLCCKQIKFKEDSE
jgi:hypothetical protein